MKPTTQFQLNDRERLSVMRLNEIPDTIRRLGFQNPIVAQILQQYAREHIITPTECLAQIIVALNKNWREEQKRAFEMIQRLGGEGFLHIGALPKDTVIFDPEAAD